MRNRTLAALAAVSLAAFAVPAFAQNSPFMGGDYVSVTGISVDDGHALDYENFLVSTRAKQDAYQKSQGWIVSTEYLANVYRRKGEPDIYLVTRFKNIPDAAEGERRATMMRNFMQMDDAKSEAGAAMRAKFRHVDGSQLLQVLVAR
jgi:hypothetical protein